MLGVEQDRETMWMVVENKLPVQMGNMTFCGAAYGIFPTREAAKVYQEDNNLLTLTHLVEV